MQEHESPVVRCAATKAIVVCTVSAPAIIRRVVDKSPEVRVAAYEILRDSISPKILNAQLRAYLLLAGLNDENGTKNGFTDWAFVRSFVWLIDEMFDRLVDNWAIDWLIDGLTLI